MFRRNFNSVGKATALQIAMKIVYSAFVYPWITNFLGLLRLIPLMSLRSVFSSAITQGLPVEKVRLLPVLYFHPLKRKDIFI